MELNKKDGNVITPVTSDGLLTVTRVNGDMNCNSRVDMGDATLILRDVVGLSIPRCWE